MRPRIVPDRISDDVFEFKVATPAKAQALANMLRASGQAEDVVAGLASVSVRFDPLSLDEITDWLDTIPDFETPIAANEPVIDINVRYGGENGPDFEHVCGVLDLSRDAFIAAHTSPIHTAEMIGFTPGFSYISGLPEAFSVPRLADPRPRVAAGSVGISTTFTGIYALSGPGGWPLIGKTSASLFNAKRHDPFLLKPGQRLRFKAA